jgi:sulfate adenylyltransferase subunit 1
MTGTTTLRVMTAGSVDDGKSTLIGRLLHDLDLITDDVLQDLKAASQRTGRGELDLSLYTDGLIAEREQGITIDVAYRYFRYKERSFILCDAPGHLQYTRNMVCAASQVDVVLIMVDARSGATEQTRRHLRIAEMLQVKNIIFVLNKLDLIDFSRQRFLEIQADLQKLSPVQVVPVCALDGDNIVHASHAIGDNRLHWYHGPTLIDILLKTQTPSRYRIESKLRLFVQSVLRPTGENNADLHDYRAITGRIDSGSLSVGQSIKVFNASGQDAQPCVVTKILTTSGSVQTAPAGASVSVTLSDEIDVARGDLIADSQDTPPSHLELTATWCWMHEKPAFVGQTLLVKQASRTVRAKIDAIVSKLDLVSGHFHSSIDNGASTLKANEIGKIKLRLMQPLLNDDYAKFPGTGSLIAIDPQKFDTLAAAVLGGDKVVNLTEQT